MNIAALALFLLICAASNSGVLCISSSDLQQKLLRRESASSKPLIAADLPRELRDLGLGALGSEQRLSEVLHGMSSPENVTVAGVKLSLAHAGEEAAFSANWPDSYNFKSIGENDGIILDIGGNVGGYSLSAAKMFPGMQVITVEPVPDTFFFLCYNLFLNGIPMIREADIGQANRPGVFPLHAAVKSEDKRVQIGYSNQKSQNAGVDIDYSVAVGWHSAEVVEMNLTKFIESHSKKVIRLLKMDCEGCEYSAIPQMGALFSDKTRVQRFSAEIHLSLKNSTETTYVRKPSSVAISALDDALRARGCRVGAQVVSC